jgi:putative nucleotidyltransferase with HDIG domain
VNLQHTLNIPDILKGLPGQTYLVGGSVRDMLMGLHPEDHDVVVDGNPLPIADLLAKRSGGRVVVLGRGSHRLYRIVGPQWHIDLSRMKGSDITDDLGGRDFVINAMASPLDSGRVIDPFGGRNDLQTRRIRMIHPQGFDDDPLRLLRAYRMAASSKFQIDAPTKKTIAAKAASIRVVAGERIWNELQQILKTANSHLQIEAMSSSGLLISLFPELAALKTCGQNQHHMMNAYDHSMAAYNALESIASNPSFYLGVKCNIIKNSIKNNDLIILKLSVLLHDIGKPVARSTDSNGKIHFYGHAKQGAVMSERIGRRLRLPGDQIHQLGFLVQHHHDPLMLYLAYQRKKNLSPRAKARFFRRCSQRSPHVLIHALADEMGKTLFDMDKFANNPKAQFFSDLMETYCATVAPLQSRPRILNGRDLMAEFHLPPSPFIGRLLKKVETAQLAGEVSNRKEALKWVADHFGPHHRQDDQ